MMTTGSDDLMTWACACAQQQLQMLREANCTVVYHDSISRFSSDATPLERATGNGVHGIICWDHISNLT